MVKPIRVLLIEDNPGDARLIQTMLGEARGLSFELDWADSLTAGLARLASGNTDIVLLDLGLPESAGIDTLHRVLMHDPKVPTLVVLSGLTDEEVAVQAVQSGAQDYLVKGQVDSALLARSIRYAIGRSQAEEALRRAHDELERRVEERTAELAATIDALQAEATERQQADDALQESQRLLQAVMDAASALIFIKTVEGAYLLVNRAFEDLYGVTREWIIGKTDYDLFPFDYAEGYRAFDQRVLEDAAPRSEEVRVPVRDTVLTFLTAKCQLVDMTGHVYGVCGISTDISDRKRAEEELMRHRDHLEELVRERTAELQVAKERAEIANRVKSAFLATMSHELRTPLNAVLGYVQILKRDKTIGERQVNGLNTIEQSSQHLLTLINDILDVSKIEAGKLELLPEPVNLSAFLTVIADIIRVKAEQKDLLFDFDASPELPQAVLLDEKRLRQVLLNLLGNAVKFTDQGSVRLSVRRLQSPAGEVRMRFEVQDTGVGMTAQQLSTIFHPFEQVGESQRRASGTGLGLTISRQLVRLMGSDIHVDSQPGKGSQFWFVLSALVSQEETFPATAVEEAVVGYEGPPHKILIVDDVPANRAMLADLLSSLGFEVCEAADGMQALELVLSEHPHLVLMDVVMPGVDGLEATRRLRQQPGLRQLPIIAVSASAGWEHQAETLSAGASGFLAKPVEQGQLFAQIGRLLGLEWRVESTADADAGDTGGELVAPPPDEMEILYELALTGNMREIRRRVSYLDGLDPRFAAFCQKLDRLARECQSKAILRLVQAQLTRHTP